MSGSVHSRELKMTGVRQLASGEKRPAQICCEHNAGFERGFALEK